MTAIADFAAFIATPGPAEDATRAAVRLHVMDTVGALLAAAPTGEGQALLRFRREAAPSDGPLANLLTLCALTRLSEIDSIHLAGMITPGAIVIPGALAVAAAQPRRDPDLLIDAIVAGIEAMVRLGLALDGPTILYRGIWSSYFAAPFGMAAAASRLLRLDAAKTGHALALAMTYAAPGVGHHNAPTTARWLSAGQAACNGLAAAQAAQAGFTSDLALLDGAFFPTVYSITPMPAALTDSLGGRPALLDLSFKPWCAARQTMPATQALREIVAAGVAPDAIGTVKASIVPAHRRMIDHGVTPGDRASYLTSVQYNMAVAAVAPQLADSLAPVPEAIPEAVHAFMRKITVEPDDALAADYPRVWPAHVAVTTASGSHERRVTSVPGDPAQPFGEAEVVAKFRRFVTPVIGEERANAMLAIASAAVAGDRSAADLVSEIERHATMLAEPSTHPR